ncbi:MULTISPECIES: hypothetical protein [unclassified Streptomyces]|uniref:hypothetical protein n=1 Tax=unclassified Streptomyces TaxID=2593676 RepID=UPI0036FF981B
MADIQELLAELRALPCTSPRTARELAATVARARSAAGRWADVLYDLRLWAAAYAGPRAAAALEIAFRKAEESFVELEIAHRDLARPAEDGTGRP